MATLALTVAGAAAGNALLPAGLAVLGTTISGAVIGSQVGALAGSYVDQALFGSSGQARSISGPRLADLTVTTSTEGSPIPRLFGSARVGGQVIWATDLEEVATTSSSGSGKGTGASGSSSATVTRYTYFANFAVSLCEGSITSLGRVWADGNELDLSAYTWRLYTGDEAQQPDPLIIANEGAANAPAYRGTAYIVFERMPLASFGRRIPQLSFEVNRAVDSFEPEVRAVVMIPGSGEFVYATEAVTRRTGQASTLAENTNTLAGGTDWEVSLDQLAAALPNAHSTSLVVSWFGTDLRAGHAQIRPAVDSAQKDTSPLVWSVAGLDRASAPLVSTIDGVAAYGGTPSDDTVVAAIADLKARGHQILLTPFILMDVPAGNALPDPWWGGPSQPAYPWRGRITCDPAPGRPGTPDKTATATAQIASFVGTALPSHFTNADGTVVYSGPAEWSLRRMILHYANLAVAAGGVDAIVIGTELRGLTQVRSGPGTYPFVAALVALAADVKSIVGPSTKVTYAADWSEYFGHHASDGSNDVYFHLDPLWSSPSIDAVAIDCYWPLADWRDGDHLDAATARSIYDLAYLKANLFAGEGYDWYYASQADRDTQRRSAITDGGAGKPWVFRYKDVRSWWQNRHFDRPGGTEQATPTAWLPQSKPIWFTEIGCPAVDKGANQPNVFVDPKSSESNLPYYSRGERDDLMQRRYLQAFLEAFDPASPGAVPGANPISAVYGGPMLDLGHVHVYCWDARPYPAFPLDDLVWGDSANWRLGHWLCGRISGQALSSVAAALLGSYGFDRFDVSGLDGLVSGLVIDRTMSAREALQPLELAFFVDTIESGDVVRLQQRSAGGIAATFTTDALVETKPGADLLSLTRAQETDLPAAARLTYSGIETDYRQATAWSRRLTGASGRVSEAQLALVMGTEQATRTADTWLFESWAAREQAHFVLPPSSLALEPGDVVALTIDGGRRFVRITGMGDHGQREIDALSIDPDLYDGAVGIQRPDASSGGPTSGPILGLFLDLPLLTGAEPPEAGYVAAARTPWPGGAAFYRSPDTSGFALSVVAASTSTTGTTLDPLPPGPEGRLDRATSFRVRLDTGTLASVTPIAMLAGANALAVESADSVWEVLQFETATLVAPQTYQLGTLLRGQAGTEGGMATTVAAGARVVLLDAALTQVPLTPGDIGLALNWRYGPSDLDIANAAYTTAVHSFQGLGYRPLSPVHVEGTRLGGDLQLSWIRRTRIGGDSWATTEVPLAEDAELYAVDILSGANVVRTLSTSQPAVTYAAADQITDFGAVQPAISVRVFQVSATFGRGSPRSALV